MSRIPKLAIAAAALTLIALSYAWSQPGAAGGRGGGGGGGFGVVSAELVLGYLALDPEVNLTDVQLVQVRNALRASYRDQLKMREEMRSSSGGGAEGDVQRLREEMMAMREGMMKAVKANLTEAQYATFTAAQERLQGSRGPGGGRRGGGGAQ